MKKILSIIALSSFASFFLLQTLHASVPSDVISYLQSQNQSNEWVVMALKASGQNPSSNDIAINNLTVATTVQRKILGVVAGGGNPYNASGTDLVQTLDGFVANNQIGDVNLVNDDIWGILAYISAGVDKSDARISDSKNFLIANQNQDGGWGYAPGTSSDSNDTAMAITALIKAGVSPSDSVITNAFSFLSSLQNPDGGFASLAGQSSDSASTAWTISAYDAAGSTPPAGSFDFLDTLKTSDGSYKWMSSDTSGNAGMTAYVAIALAGTSYPVNIYSASSGGSQNNSGGGSNNGGGSQQEEQQQTSGLTQFRIEGSQEQVCQGEVQATDALQLVELASELCDFSYVIETLSFGDYLKSINSDEAQGLVGWLYLVDWTQPSVGAGDYALTGDEYVTWYFGEFDWEPLRITEESRDNETGDIQFVVESYNQFSWSTVSGAKVYIDEQEFTTNGTGQITATLSEGIYTAWAEKENYIRSNALEIAMGELAQTSLQLETTIVEHQQSGGGGGGGSVITNPTTQPEVSFTVDTSSLSFGDLLAGQSATTTFSITNDHETKDITISAEVTGDDLFKDFLKLDDLLWSLFSKLIPAGDEVQVEAQLEIPSNYDNYGTKQGELIIWAEL